MRFGNIIADFPKRMLTCNDKFVAARLSRPGGLKAHQKTGARLFQYRNQSISNAAGSSAGSGSPTQLYMISQSNVTCSGRWKWSFARAKIASPSMNHVSSVGVQRKPYSWKSAAGSNASATFRLFSGSFSTPPWTTPSRYGVRRRWTVPCQSRSEPCMYGQKGVE